MQGSGVQLEVSHTRQTQDRQGHKRDKTDRDKNLTHIKKWIIFPAACGGGLIMFLVGGGPAMIIVSTF